MYPKTLFTILMTCMVSVSVAQRWKLSPGKGISWVVNTQAAHTDQIEMSGTKVSAIIKYGVDKDGTLVLDKHLVFPMLRIIPNDTYGSLAADFEGKNGWQLTSNGVLLNEHPASFAIKNGELETVTAAGNNIVIKRSIFPSVDEADLIEIVEVTNNELLPLNLKLQNLSPAIETDAAKGVYGSYHIKAELRGQDSFTIAAGGKYRFSIVYGAKKAADPPHFHSAAFEQQKRARFASEVFNNLVLETPNDTINQAFAFAKLRTAESIFDTKVGLLHSPGGGAYYAAIWANDQAEYTNPFFPFLGNSNGNEAALNSYRLFATYMNPQYKPIPSSIVAEGEGFWNGAGDRGDMAMIAYGAARYALASGRHETASELWPLIIWCLEYLQRQTNTEGVIKSASDELEGRFPAGKINLSTNTLAYGAYISAANLAQSLGNNDIANQYRQKAAALRKAIEQYFGAQVQGFKTYRYYDGNTKLRSWICLPLVIGITERKEGTVNALFSPYLWSANGILTESGSTTFWDRATLYAFRGLLASGATDRCMPYINYYSATRLLGEHVPYPVEAWPEGGQRHLAAESALYCRVFTEGLFGLEPTGLKSFRMIPALPKGWNRMKLRNIRAFDTTFDISVTRNGHRQLVTVTQAGGKTVRKQWDGKQAIYINLL